MATVFTLMLLYSEVKKSQTSFHTKMNDNTIQLDVKKVSQGGSRAQASMSRCESDVLSKCKNLKPI